MTVQQSETTPTATHTPQKKAGGKKTKKLNSTHIRVCLSDSVSLCLSLSLSLSVCLSSRHSKISTNCFFWFLFYNLIQVKWTDQNVQLRTHTHPTHGLRVYLNAFAGCICSSLPLSLDLSLFLPPSPSLCVTVSTVYLPLFQCPLPPPPPLSDLSTSFPPPPHPAFSLPPFCGGMHWWTMNETSAMTTSLRPKLEHRSHTLVLPARHSSFRNHSGLFYAPLHSDGACFLRHFNCSTIISTDRPQAN